MTRILIHRSVFIESVCAQAEQQGYIQEIPMLNGLAGKKVIVTGGGTGIGKAISDRFLAEGSEVLVIDKDEKNLRGARKNYSELCLDITDSEAVRRSLLGVTCDILVNNAAITTGDDHEAITAVNYTATRFITQEVLPGMKSRRSGNVVFIGSVHTAVAFPGSAAYRGSKAAIVAYMGVRAIELARYGIRLNAVSPGAIQDAGTNRDQKIISKNKKHIPMGRYGLPSEIAAAVAFLASDEASYVTAAEFRVDGGLSQSSAFPG